MSTQNASTTDTHLSTHPTVKDSTVKNTPTPNGYVLSARREDDKSDKQAMAVSILRVALALRENPLSWQQYETFRKAHPTEDLYCAERIRRVFGTWNAAVVEAGLDPNTNDRDYDGLTEQDAMVWLAHWLRHYAIAGRGTVRATLDEYTQWARRHPAAPCGQLVKNFGFGRLSHLAADLERSADILPSPRPVGRKGRRKDAA